MDRLPAFAAWRHCDLREGTEVAFFARAGAGARVEGHTAAVEAGDAFAVRYLLERDDAWRTRTARVWGRSAAGESSTVIEGNGDGSWRVDGRAAPHLDGCLDVDLEASVLTNAFPVRRLGLAPGAAADAPAAYVRALGLGVERLEQRYERVDGGDARRRFAYAAPAFGFTAELAYDEDGLVRLYPGLAERIA